jgi:DNA/RNA-binding domain of Phe-tRNA-synthetase-like protein
MAITYHVVFPYVQADQYEKQGSQDVQGEQARVQDDGDKVQNNPKINEIIRDALPKLKTDPKRKKPCLFPHRFVSCASVHVFFWNC